MRLDVYHHFPEAASVPPWAAAISDKLMAIINALHALHEGETTIMATLDEVLAKVTEANTKEDSIIALVSGLKQQLADALAGVTLPPAVQAKVDAIFDQASQDVTKIDAALAANVAPAPVA